MTSFPKPSLTRSVVDSFDDPTESTADRIDREVSTSRSMTPTEVANKRTSPRFSIRELNDLDLEQIKERMRHTAFDQRGPITRFLDLLDVPRNTIASTLFPAIRRRKENEGETGTGGRGVVKFSDILGEIGMRPGIVRGVLGFAGDLATDPLTYVGGGGAVKTLASKAAGQSVRVGRSGTRALRGGIKALEQGREIANPVVKEVADQFLRPDVLARLDKLRVSKGLAPLSGKDKAAFLSKRVFGDPAVRKTVAQRFLRPSYEQGGSQIAGRFNRPSGLADLPEDEIRAVTGSTWNNTRTLNAFDGRNKAVKNFVAEYGAAAKQGPGPIGLFRREGQAIPSLRIGDGGSLVAHIPLTDIGIYAPSLTAPAAAAVGARAAALASAGAPQLAGLVGESYRAAKENLELVREISRANNGVNYHTLRGDPDATKAATEYRDSLLAKSRENVAKMRLDYDRIASDPNAFPRLSVGDMQYQRQMADTAEAAAKASEAELDWYPFSQQLRERLKGGTASSAFDPDWARAGRRTMLDSALAKATVEGVPDPLRRAEDIVQESFAKKQRDLLDMADIDFDESMARAEALHNHMEAAWRLAARTKTSIAQHLDDPARDLVENAKTILGLGPDAMGTSIFTPYKTVAESVASDGEVPFQNAADDMARIGRDVLGNRRTTINDARSRLVNLERGGGIDIGNAATQQMQNGFAALARKNNWTAEQQDLARTLMYARMYESHPNAGNAFYLTDLDGNPSELVQRIQRARDSGLATPEVMKGIDELVEQARALNTDLGRYGVEAGALRGSQVIADHVPKGLTKEARDVIAKRGESPNKTPKGEADFAQPSQTWQYRFKGADGKVKRFFEADRRLAGLTDEQIDAFEWTDEMRAQAKEVRDTVQEFDKLYEGVDPALRTQLLGKPTDPFELNKLADEGYFDYLTGRTDRGMRLFAEDPIWVMRNRVAEQAKATARKSFVNQVGQYGIDIAEQVRKEADEKGVFTFSNGTRGNVLPGGRISVGGVIYRPLKSDLPIEQSLMAGVLENRDLSKLYPEQVAEQIERAVNWSADAANQGALLNTLDRFTGFWKGLALARPAWVIFNIVGNLWQMGMGGVDPRSLGRMAKPMMEALWLSKNPEELLKRTVKIRGVDVPLDTLRMEAIERGVLNTNSAAETTNLLFPDGTFRPTIAKPPEGVKGWATEKGARFRQSFERVMGRAMRGRAVAAAKTPADKLKAAASAVNDEGYARKLLNPFAAMNGFVENWMRLSAYAALLDQGMDAGTAAMKVKEFLYDYSDLTKFEAHARRVAPFFSFIRNNAGYQLRQFVQNPKWATLYPKIKEAIEEAVAGEQQLPEHMRPTWMREQLATQLTADPDSRTSFTATNVLPIEPVLHAGAAATGGWKGIMDASQYASSSLNPLFTFWQQLGAGREFFSGRSIGADATEGDISASEVAWNTAVPGTIRDFVQPFGSRTPAGVSSFQRSPASGALRLALGGRVQPMDDQRLEFQTMREFKDREERIRKAISVAEREGNIEASQAARARLLQLWDMARKMGLERGIPKYGLNQLEQINAELQGVGG